jgi:hypothetical protein
MVQESLKVTLVQSGGNGLERHDGQKESEL